MGASADILDRWAVKGGFGRIKAFLNFLLLQIKDYQVLLGNPFPKLGRLLFIRKARRFKGSWANFFQGRRLVAKIGLVYKRIFHSSKILTQEEFYPFQGLLGTQGPNQG